MYTGLCTRSPEMLSVSHVDIASSIEYTGFENPSVAVEIRDIRLVGSTRRLPVPDFHNTVVSSLSSQCLTVTGSLPLIRKYIMPAIEITRSGQNKL